MTTILIVEDDDAVRTSFVFYFQAEGYNVIEAHDGETALSLLSEDRPEIIILDVRLPDVDGIELCRVIREKLGPNVGIIMISGIKKDLLNRLLGLRIGADVYLTKPFETIELEAYVRALERKINPVKGFEEDKWIIIDDQLKIQVIKHEVEVNGQTVDLTDLQFRLLVYLFKRAGIPCSRSELLVYVWRYKKPEDVPMEGVVNTCIRRLREKIEPEPSNPIYILTVFGYGYKFMDIQD